MFGLVAPTWATAVLAPCLPLGCGQPAQSSAVIAEPPQADAATTFDAGVLCPGERLAHTFPFVNRTTEELVIAADSDITVGCGCTSLTPAARAVAPGAAVDLALVVNTERLSGPFSYASSVTWTGAGGRRVPVKVVVAGEALPLCAPTPDTLTFAPGEGSEAKSVLVAGNRFVTLGNWRAVSSSPAFRVAGVETVDPRTARVRVTCDAAGELAAGELTVTADVTGSERAISLREATVTVPLRGGSPPDFAVMPTRLAARLDPVSKRAVGSLLLRGSSVTGASVLDVKCGTHPVEWKFTPASGGGVLSVGIGDVAGAVRPTAIVISVRGKGDITVALLVTG